MSSFLFVLGSIVLFLLILSVLVIAHELGHFLVARWSGIRVEEFGLGYPPRAKTLFQKAGTVFTLNWLPFGGFVKIFGEDGSEELSPEDYKQSFVSKPRYIQALVLVAGVLMNFLVGWILITGLYMHGTTIIFDDTLNQKYLNNTQLLVQGVVADGPADEAKVKTGDIITKIVSVDGTKTLDSYTPEALTQFIRTSGGTPLTFDLERNKTPVEVVVTPKYNEASKNFMVGISPSLAGYIHLSFIGSITQGFHSSITLLKETAQGIGGLVTRKVSFDEVSGPVGMVSMVGDASRMGIEYVLLFAALISLSLAVVNLIPFPALDGGRLLFVVIEAIIRRPIPSKITAWVNTAGFFILIALMLFVTYHDIAKLVHP